MEITNDSQVEKHRLYSLAMLVADSKKISRQNVLNILQPPSLLRASHNSNPSSSGKATVRIAEDCKIIRLDDDGFYVLNIPLNTLQSIQTFRHYMSTFIFGATEQDQSNYIFNLFSAWYATQNEQVFDETLNYDVAFCETLFPNVPQNDRPFNSTKFSAWRKWAAFLGLGYISRFRNKDFLVPDATERLRDILPSIFRANNVMQFGTFIEHTALYCPELDEGILFRRCWEASYGTEVQANQLSLITSTGLRTLDALGVIRLVYRADAINTWRLYPAQGSIHQQISHIEFIGAN